MNITVVPGRLVAPEHIDAWSNLQRLDAALSSPFLSPDFTLAVAAVRDDVEVGVLAQGSTAVGFFPFQRGRFRVGYPVGGWLNEVQAVIMEPGVAWDSVDLIRGCGLLEWDFTRLVGSQHAFEPFQYRRRTAAFIDLPRGYARYAAERRQAGSGEIPKIDALARKLAREVGPLQFDLHSSDAMLLHTLMKWKLDRYSRHGYVDIFAIPWVRQLLERIHATQTPRFGGLLSVLYAGEELVAVHLGMRSHDVWHYWYPAYNPTFARYSPGLILLLRMAQHASTLGLRRIELGGSDEYPYKQRLMNGSDVLLEGAVGRVAAVSAARRWRHLGESWIRESALLHPPARAVLRAFRRIKHTVQYELRDAPGRARRHSPRP